MEPCRSCHAAARPAHSRTQRGLLLQLSVLVFSLVQLDDIDGFAIVRVDYFIVTDDDFRYGQPYR
jgi:hypothetical protein